MKEVILKIPDPKLDFFMELSQQLGFEAVQEIAIAEEHKDIVRERIRIAQPEQMIPWQEARKQFTFKGTS